MRPRLNPVTLLIAAALLATPVMGQLSDDSYYNCRYDYDVFLENLPDFDQRRSPMRCSGANHCYPASIVNMFAYMADHGNAGPDPDLGIGPGYSAYTDDPVKFQAVSNYIERTGRNLGTTCTFGTVSMFQVNLVLRLELGKSPYRYRLVNADVRRRWSPSADDLVRDMNNSRAMVVLFYGKYPHFSCGNILIGDWECLAISTGGHVMLLAGGTNVDTPGSCDSHGGRLLKFSNSSWGEYGGQDYAVQSAYETTQYAPVIHERVVRGIFPTRMARLRNLPGDDSTRWKLIRGFNSIAPQGGATWQPTPQGPQLALVTQVWKEVGEIDIITDYIPDAPPGLDQVLDVAISPYDENIWSVVRTGKLNRIVRTDPFTGEWTFLDEDQEIGLVNPSNVVFDRFRYLAILDGNELIRYPFDLDPEVAMLPTTEDLDNGVGWHDPIARRTLQTEPESLGYSEAAGAFYAYDSDTGLLSVIDDLDYEDREIVSLGLQPGLTNLANLAIIRSEVPKIGFVDTVLLVDPQSNRVHTVSLQGDTALDYKTYDVDGAVGCTSITATDEGTALLLIDGRWREFSFEFGGGFTEIFGNPFLQADLGEHADIMRSTSNREMENNEGNGQEDVLTDADYNDTVYCLGDLDGDGFVDGIDLGLLISAWGTDEPFADLDESGTIDGGDLGLIFSAWGACAPTENP